MEYLLHYTWQHRLYDPSALTTAEGEPVEVIDPGIHNLSHSGPDFFNAKIRLGGILWAGNVEIHSRSSDWYQHHHEADPAYDNVILHVVGHLDADRILTQDGKLLPQLALAVPAALSARYQALQDEERYPPCYRVIPRVDDLTVHAWLSRLTVERLEEKTARINGYLADTLNDWERTCFITLARSFGFGTNADAFEEWARRIEPGAVGRHRDDLFQVEAFFLGQAGLLDDTLVPPERRDAYYERIKEEYAFLRHKFTLTPMSPARWKFGRLRPQNFPHVRLSQFANLYYESRFNFSRLIEAPDLPALYDLFRVGATPYWRTHYAFGETGAESSKVLRRDSLNLLVINVAAPLLFAYGRDRLDEEMAERAFSLLEELPPERNHVIRCWQRAGLTVAHAADSQALLRLRRRYCDRKDCLRCRFGAEYMRADGMPDAIT